MYEADTVQFLILLPTAEDDITGDDFFALTDDDEMIQTDDDEGGEGDDVPEIEQDDFFVDDGVRTFFLTPFLDSIFCSANNRLLQV